MESVTSAEGKHSGQGGATCSSLSVLKRKEVLLCAFGTAEPDTEWTINEGLLN